MANDPFSGLYSDPYAVLRIKRSVEALNARPGHTVLDVGCYEQLAYTFLPKGVIYEGIDLDRFHPFTNVVNIDGGFEHEPVDRILCLETLEHLMRPQGTLKSIRACLKDDGVAVISLPNEATLFHRVRALLGTVDQEAFGECGKHLHMPNMKQSIRFLSQELSVVQAIPYASDGAGTRSPWLRPLLRILPLELLARLLPSLFARGFIFVCKKNIN